MSTKNARGPAADPAAPAAIPYRLVAMKQKSCSVSLTSRSLAARQARLEEANRALEIMSHRAKLILDEGGKLYAVNSNPNTRWPFRFVPRIRRDGTWFERLPKSADLGGGTMHQCLVQIVRWVRGDTRWALRTWTYLTGPSVGLAREGGRGAELCAFLAASSYNDPEAMACVLCGDGDNIGDWWANGDLIGPCCSGRAGCKQQWPPVLAAPHPMECTAPSRETDTARGGVAP